MQKDYTFEIIPKNWAKRRKPIKTPQATCVEIPDFELVANHFCNMHVTYDDGSQKVFFSRVIQNHITHQWTVDGMHVSVKVIMPQDQN